MIEWIIAGVLTLVLSEVMFIRNANEDEWVQHKILSLFLGASISLFFFLLPYNFAYNCGFIMGEGYECVNYGIQVFYWMYGIIIGVVLFFLLNGWLIKKIRKKKK